MKKFCKFGIGIAVAIFVYVWFMWNLIPDGMTPFGQLSPANPEDGGSRFIVTLLPFVVAFGAGVVGQAVGWLVYGIYSFLYFLAHSWVDIRERKHIVR